MFWVALQDALLAFAPDRSLLDPAGGDIDAIYGVDELARGRIAAMRDGVGLQKIRDCLIPLIGFDWDVLFDNRTWFGGGKAALAVSGSKRLKGAVYGGSRYGWKDMNSFGF